MNNSRKKPLVLCILDGWGIGNGGEYDAIASARTPNYDHMMQKYPNCTLTTFGKQVGLPEGQMGNSEVGHMNIGAGRVVMQFLPRVDKAFDDDVVANDPQIIAMAKVLKSTGKACHIMGLASDGGVHAHLDHIIKLAKIMSKHGVQVHIHAFTDGRDTPPQSGKDFIEKLNNEISTQTNISLSTICGRYYAMDRDKRWERVKIAYDAIVSGKGGCMMIEPLAAILESYDAGLTDEFIKPIIKNGYTGINEGDAIIFANFRSDRARQILQALLYKNFDDFAREAKPDISSAIGMVEYSDELNKIMGVLFPPQEIKNLLGEVVSEAGLKQVRMAETEKYPHVTFFFNGGEEAKFEGEERILVSSPKVATYDLQPEMSAPELSEKLLKAIDSDKFDVVIVNFANTDMVGHTGSVIAARRAAETVDEAIGKLENLVLKKGGVLLITADHGNADQMYDPITNGPHTAHTMNPVPFILVGAGKIKLKKNGKLADIAPTMLHFLGIKQPKEMDGVCLVS